MDNFSVQLGFQEKQVNEYYLQIFDKQIIHTKDPQWARLVGIWHENQNGQIYTHAYAFRINKIHGGFYLDCQPTKLFLKTFCQLLFRPFFTLCKTIYHVSMLPILAEIGLALEQRSSLKECMHNGFKSLADIIRTPVYGLALTVASIGFIFLGMLNPNTIYSGSALIGEIERQANWGECQTYWTLAKCFQPFSWEQLLDSKYEQEHGDTIYLDSDVTIKLLTNFTRARILYMRNQYDPYDCQQLDKHAAYISPYLKL